MAKCDHCGNDYDKAFQIHTADGESYVFDSFECAIQKTAPLCAHCKLRIIGHGLERQGAIFCCNHCARQQNVPGLSERA